MRNAFASTRLSVFFLALLCTPHAKSALPKDAQQILDTFPEKAVTIDLVISKALGYSDAFRSIIGGSLSIEAPKLKAKSALEPRFYIKIQKSDDQTKPANPFQLSRIQSTADIIGMSKLFSTGTKLSAEITHSFQTLTHPTIPIAPYYETKGKIQLSQSLWKDSFGYGTQRMIEAADLSSQANELQYQEDLENGVVSLTELFYNAWLAQAQAKLSDESLQRRAKLLKVTKIKRRRGTAEDQDLLQIESAYLNSQVQQQAAQERLIVVWRQLVTYLKLPENWLNIDPKEIPIRLDDQILETAKTCGNGGQISAAPNSSASTKKADMMAKAAILNVERSSNALKPDVQLAVQFQGNGINASRGPSFDEALRVDNPGWAVELSLNLPLSRHAEEAELRQAIAQQIRAEAAQSQAQSQLRLDWLTLCNELGRQQKTRSQVEQAFKNQQRRADIEQRLFSIGRSPTINVIQAEDDATAARSSLNETEAQLRMTVWKIRLVRDEIPAYLKSLGFDQKVAEKKLQGF